MSNQNVNQMGGISNTMIALYNFDAEDEPEISMKKGDRMEMLDMDPALNGWAYAKKADGSEGYVPISYLSSANINNRAQKHSKSNQHSRSSSPNPVNNNTKDMRQQNNYQNRQNNFRNQNQNQNQNYNQNNQTNQSVTEVNNPNSNNNPNQNQNPHNPNNQSNNTNNGNNNSLNSPNQNNKGNSNNTLNDNDTKQIICSFHRDFIPEMNDLYKYFGEFGKITNKLEIEYDTKKVPLAKIKFASAQCVDKVCDKGGRQQIPSGAQNGTIHIRVYRSMHDYIQNTQRSHHNRGGYNKHKNSRRGGF